MSPSSFIGRKSAIFHSVKHKMLVCANFLAGTMIIGKDYSSLITVADRFASPRLAEHLIKFLWGVQFPGGDPIKPQHLMWS